VVILPQRGARQEGLGCRVRRRIVGAAVASGEGNGVKVYFGRVVRSSGRGGGGEAGSLVDNRARVCSRLRR